MKRITLLAVLILFGCVQLSTACDMECQDRKAKLELASLVAKSNTDFNLQGFERDLKEKLENLKSEILETVRRIK
jgi:outer membrane lipopolysaccharide assembly protein LptE/RlpB